MRTGDLPIALRPQNGTDIRDWKGCQTWQRDGSEWLAAGDAKHAVISGIAIAKGLPILGQRRAVVGVQAEFKAKGVLIGPSDC